MRIPIRHSIALTLIFMIFALSRGFTLSEIHQLPLFTPLHARADGEFFSGDFGGDIGAAVGGDAGAFAGDIGTAVGGDASGFVGDIGTAVGGDAFTDIGTAVGGDAFTVGDIGTAVGGDAFTDIGTAVGGDASTPPVTTDTGASIPPPIETIVVIPPPAPVCTLSASPTSVVGGSASTLSWTTANAADFSIDNGVGSVTPVESGSTSVAPAVTTTYTGTATGPGGSVQCAASVTVTVTPPPSPVLACTLAADPTSVTSGSSSTLTWTTENATAFSIDNGIGSVTPVSGGSVTTPAVSANTTFTGSATDAVGGTITCAATVTIATSGGGGGGGGGGGSRSLPRVAIGQVLGASISLAELPYTGLDLGPLGTALYWTALIFWSLALAYLVLFGAVPLVGRSARNFGYRVQEVLAARESLSGRSSEPNEKEEPAAPAMQARQASELREAPRGYSPYEGFKSFAHNGALSIDDIVKGLARNHPAPEPEPVRENIEPIYQNVEPIENAARAGVAASSTAPIHIRGLIAALVEGDRAAVFAGLRQHMRGGGPSEQLISNMVFLLDDAYRARIDGTECDADVARVIARLDTPTLEKLVAALTTAIDSSYSAGVTGAKLALTRALAVLGA